MRTCTACGFHNLDTRERCMKCDAILTHVEPPASARGLSGWLRVRFRAAGASFRSRGLRAARAFALSTCALREGGLEPSVDLCNLSIRIDHAHAHALL